MCLLTKSGGHKSCGNGDVNYFIKSYVNISEKAELTASVRHIDHKSCGNGDVNSFIKSYVNISEKAELASVRLLRDFQNLKYRVRIQKSWKSLKEKTKGNCKTLCFTSICKKCDHETVKEVLLRQ